jgi:tetraprenyl-beta-curcumene synthase
MSMLDINLRDRAHAPGSSRATVHDTRRTSAHRRLGLAPVFAATVLRYTGSILPQVRRELSYWRACAAEIPDPVLRNLAYEALGKRGNIEGAALFATLAPRTHRRETVCALVCFQLAYNYLDALGERSSAYPTATAHQLHQALLVALDPYALHCDYYARYPHHDDRGYLSELVDACRAALAGLPAYRAVAGRAQTAAARIVAFQSLNLSESQGGHNTLKRWALREIPAGSGLTWSEVAAAAGSSLLVHALIAVAAQSGANVDLDALERAYFPHLSALHSLLDSLVDRAEDEQHGQHSLLDYYSSTSLAALNLGSLARSAKASLELLPDSAKHEVIMSAMASYYLSAAECETREAAEVSNALKGLLGAPLSVAVSIFKARRLGFSLAHRSYA